MKRIAYAEEWLTTDDRVADLVLEYARSLARHETADTITIPVLEGTVLRHAQILIGPSSQIIVVESDEVTPPHFEVESEVAITDLQSRLRQLSTPASVPYEREGDKPAQLPEDDRLPEA
jgi:hypothetical protein